MGLAAYARAFILQDATNIKLNSVSTGNGFSGSYTKINGLLSYYEVIIYFNGIFSLLLKTWYKFKVCEKRKRGSWKTEWVTNANAPYMYNDDGEWISFENKESLSKKVN